MIGDGFDPVFVHASPRSGSTYFFNALRRHGSLLCFNEAIIDGKHDLARFRKSRNGALSQRSDAWNVNHDFLERADFEEFLDAWDAVMHLCPKFPAFQDYLPVNGAIPDDLFNYLSALMAYARSRQRRPVFCEINSRGRAGALRSAFGGFHVTQYRDPLSQFGSFIRAVIETGFWGFLAFPATELGAGGAHPLYRLVPEASRAPALGFRADNRAEHWASDAQYFAAVGSPQAGTIEHAFRWHMFSWLLTNLAGLSYSDFALDIDKAHDDVGYRAAVAGTFAARLGIALDLSDIRKFDRYYAFESFDIKTVCSDVVSVVRGALADGRLANAVRTLGTEPPVTPTAKAVELLFAKLESSLAAMAASADTRLIGTEEWKAVAEKNRKIWFNPGVRRLAKQVYPLAAPIVWATRRAAIWYKTRHAVRPSVNR